MLYRIREGENFTFQPYTERSASELDLAEKDLENWIATNPELLFSTEQVLVITQSVAGQSMADILALDADGRVVIVEIKRNWSNRETVGQLLEYAAKMTEKNYEYLEERHKDYRSRYHEEGPYVSLLERFKELTDDPTVDPKDIPKRQKGHRICIVAPGSDEGLSRIVEWLKGYGVPISFVPFTLYTDTNTKDILLEIEPLPKVQEAEKNEGEWQGDWLFNTNETYAPGAYQKMFEEGVIAIYGYENGPHNLIGSEKGHRVFAYVNRQGVRAVGKIMDGHVVAGNTVFGKEQEFHVKVEWEVKVAENQGVTMANVKEATNYSLPVRNVFGRIYRPDAANWIDGQLREEKNKR